MLGSGLSNQSGAAVAALAFPVLGPVGVVAVRQWVAAAVLGAAGRPRLRSFTAAQWRPVLCLALVFAGMNLSLYAAIERIGLGLAVTLEFLGPLTVALAGSRRRTDLAAALAAAGAVAVLARPTPTTDYPGIGLALLAAVCWGCYILCNRTVGARLPGLEGSAAAALVSGALYLPVGAWALREHPPTPVALGCALAAGVLSSAVPFVSDLLALRRVPPHFFGVFMSVNPVFAALIGLAVLDQHLDAAAWVAVAVIVTANALVVTSRSSPGSPAPASEAAAACGVEQQEEGRHDSRREEGSGQGAEAPTARLRRSAESLPGTVGDKEAEHPGPGGGQGRAEGPAEVGDQSQAAEQDTGEQAEKHLDDELPHELDQEFADGLRHPTNPHDAPPPTVPRAEGHGWLQLLVCRRARCCARSRRGLERGSTSTPAPRPGVASPVRSLRARSRTSLLSGPRSM